MLGTFQQSQLRLEVEAPLTVIHDSLFQTEQLQRWLWPQRFPVGLPEQLYQGLTFTTWMGPVANPTPSGGARVQLFTLAAESGN